MTPFSRWKIIGYAAAIFVAGGISGGALGVYETKSHLFTPPRDKEIALRIRNRLKDRLGLTPDQVTKIDPIIDSAAANIHAIRIEAAQRVNKVFEDAYKQVSEILTPDQRLKLEQMQKEREMMQGRWQEGRWHPGGGPFGGPGYGGPPNSNPGSASPQP